jgi:hypothetical protein
MVQGDYRNESITRDLTRTFLKTALFILTLVGCTQSVTWLGEVSGSAHRRAPATYYRDATVDVSPVEDIDGVTGDPYDTVAHQNESRYYNDYDY